MQARAKAINKAGGLKDASGKTHQLQVIVCNSALDPNKATQCANDAVAQKVVAVIGINSSEAPQMMPILAAAGIPVIAPVVVDPSETTSKNSFPITAGVPGAFVAIPQMLASQGATKISLIYPDIPGAATAKIFVSSGIKAAGVAGRWDGTRRGRRDGPQPRDRGGDRERRRRSRRVPPR